MYAIAPSPRYIEKMIERIVSVFLSCRYNLWDCGTIDDEVTIERMVWPKIFEDYMTEIWNPLAVRHRKFDQFVPDWLERRAHGKYVRKLVKG